MEPEKKQIDDYVIKRLGQTDWVFSFINGSYCRMKIHPITKKDFDGFIEATKKDFEDSIVIPFSIGILVGI